MPAIPTPIMEFVGGRGKYDRYRNGKSKLDTTGRDVFIASRPVHVVLIMIILTGGNNMREMTLEEMKMLISVLLTLTNWLTFEM